MIQFIKNIILSLILPFLPGIEYSTIVGDAGVRPCGAFLTKGIIMSRTDRGEDIICDICNRDIIWLNENISSPMKQFKFKDKMVYICNIVTLNSSDNSYDICDICSGEIFKIFKEM